MGVALSNPPEPNEEWAEDEDEGQGDQEGYDQEFHAIISFL
jgi:hypothetical protein